jgi:hypothetical protein
VLLERGEPHGDVRLAAAERQSAGVDVDLDRDAGIAFAERRQAGNDDLGGERLHRRDPHQAFQPDVLAGDRALDGKRLGLHSLDIGEHRARPPGSARTPPACASELGACAPVERLQPPAHGRLGDVQRPGGCGQAAMPRNGEKAAQIVPVQHSALCKIA